MFSVALSAVQLRPQIYPKYMYHVCYVLMVLQYFNTMFVPVHPKKSTQAGRQGAQADICSRFL
jgi:hypothetical protein